MDQAGDGPRRWIVLVAAGQEDLYEHLCGALRADEQVEVIMDRRSDHARNPSWVNGRLLTHGAAVIRKGSWRSPEDRAW